MSAASTVALVLAAVLSAGQGAQPDGKVLHVSDSGLKSFLFDSHARLLRLTFKGKQRSKRETFSVSPLRFTE